MRRKNCHVLVVLAWIAAWWLPGTAPADPINCAQFWAVGSPLTGDHDHPCEEYPVDGGDGRIRVFTVPDFLDDTRVAAVNRVIEAAKTSMEAFDVLARMGSVYILFDDIEAALPPGRSTPIPMGVQSDYAWPEGQEPCPLLVFPFGWEGWDPDQIKQMVAHELFHCVQWQWFNAQMTGPDDGAVAWWTEGTATYFINAPYPHGDLEHLPQSQYAPGRSLMAQSYANTGFFQSYSASVGRQGVMRLLDGMPTSGGSGDQAAALSAIPEIERHFHEFGERYLDQAIPDDGGGLIGLEPQDSPVTVIDENGVVPFDFEPFLLSHHRLRFGAGATYHVEVREPAGTGLQSQRPLDSPGSWADLPDTIEVSCSDDEDRLFLATSTDLPGTPRALRLLVRREPRDDCCDTGANLDPMLVGTWQANVSDVIEQVYPQPGGTKNVTGAVTVQIGENGQFTQRYQGLTVTMNRDYPNAPTLTFSDRTDGAVHGCLTAQPMGAMGALHIQLLNRSTSLSRIHSSADARDLLSDEEHIGLAFGVPGGGAALGMIKPQGPDAFYNKKVLYRRVTEPQP